MKDIQKSLALVVGIVLSLTGALGFIMTSPLFGLFPVNLLHNLVHLSTGVLGVIAAMAAAGKWARQYNQYLGIVYIVVGVLGLVAADLMMQLLVIDMKDTILHFALGIVLAGVGFGMKK